MERREEVAVPMGLRGIIGIVILVGVIVMAAGAWGESADTMIAGSFLTSISLFSGGFFLTNEDGYARLGMFIAAGITFTLLVNLGAAGAIGSMFG